MKPIEIDDVPIVTFTLYSKLYDDYVLRRVGEEVLRRLEALENISQSQIIGGRQRELRIELDSGKLASMGLSPLEVYQALMRQNISLTAGQFERGNQLQDVFTGPFLRSVQDVKTLVVGIHDGKAVYLQDIADQIKDGPAERQSYTRIGFGPAQKELWEKYPESQSAVTLALAKKKGTNAVAVAEEAIAKLQELQKTIVPSGIEIEITRNYGATADQKVNELLLSLLFAIVTVVALLAMTMGWREALVVSFAVPISFALSLFVNLIFGYTINRVTLFALILSLGMVVDDPITNVDNIQRHILTGRRKNPLLETLFGVQEVLPPVIMSTLTIIASFIPMFFITGMMGPYMRPMAINVPLTVSFSTLCALTFVPWLSYQLLKKRHGEQRLASEKSSFAGLAETPVMRMYRKVLHPFLQHKVLGFGFLGLIVVLLAVSGLLAITGLVPLKMLPFDNKNEFQLVINMPEGSTLESTDALVQEYEQYFRQVVEVKEFISYVGAPSPIDFNGLVRHYYFRQGHHLADIRVNLLDKEERSQQSHIILLRLRPDLEKLAQKYRANVALVEIPPGPPVLATVVAEITGSPDQSYQDLIKSAQIVKQRMSQEPNMVDVDWTVEDPWIQWEFQVNKPKAALNGIDTQTVVYTLRLALDGAIAGSVHVPEERNPWTIRLILPKAQRSSITQLADLKIKGQTGNLVPLSEIGQFQQTPGEPTIYHKNLIPLVYVTADIAGRAPAQAILNLQSHFKQHPLPPGLKINWAGEGEWLITLDVFRDLGIAFGVALLCIYLLIVMETGSLFMPVIIMMAIPLTAIGIMPGFFLLNLIGTQHVGNFHEPIFFTATGMIGMIALGGIVVRNSIVLIEFIKTGQEEGLSLKDAILASGGVRFRPIMLTASTTVLGAWPITLDPIFSGLAWALIFGLVASTMFTLLVVPIVYYLIYHKASS